MVQKETFISICEQDTKELRKEIGLPITKGLQYVEGFSDFSPIKIIKKVVAYEVVDKYMPNGTYSLLITLEDGEKKRILAPYLVEMQAYNEDDVEYTIDGKRIEEFPEDYVVYDIETTGLSSKTEKIIEISAIKCRKGKIVSEFSRLISIDKMLSKKIIKLTGITDEMLNVYGVPLPQAINEFFEFIGQDILIGHNIATFDNHFVAKAAAINKKPFKNDYVDTLYIAKKYIKEATSYSLEYLSEIFGVSYEGAHRSLQDCKINNEIYLRIAKIAGHEITYVNTEIKKPIIEDAIFDNLELKLGNMCKTLSEDLKLPLNGLVVRNNNAEKYRSISICTNEPPYPCLKEDLGKIFILTSLVLISRASTKKDFDKIEVFVRVDDLAKTDVPDSATVIEKYKDGDLLNYIVQFNETDNNIVEYVKQLAYHGVKGYKTKEAPFGCCSQFEVCSDAKECLHVNKLYATACKYRYNLENGKIFYGKNKNID